MAGSKPSIDTVLISVSEINACYVKAEQMGDKPELAEFQGRQVLSERYDCLPLTNGEAANAKQLIVAGGVMAPRERDPAASSKGPEK